MHGSISLALQEEYAVDKMNKKGIDLEECLRGGGSGNVEQGRRDAG